MSADEQSTSFAPQTLRMRAVLLRGVLRRLFLNFFRPAYVRRSLALRAGACSRCGACCHLVANRCGSLHLHPDGKTTCRLYGIYRLPNCRTFPIDPRDIADRNLIAPPSTPCGYYWPE